MVARFIFIRFMLLIVFTSVLQATLTSAKMNGKPLKSFVCTHPKKEQHDPEPQEITCPYSRLPIVPNGIFRTSTCDGNHVGGVCNLTCDEGFFAASAIRTVCENVGGKSGTWSNFPDSFNCEAITCPYTDLPDVPNGFFGVTNCDGDGVGDVCTLSCCDNYYPSASNQTVCETDGSKGKWSVDDNLICTAVTCSYADLPDVLNGFFNIASCDGNQVGDACYVTCPENHFSSLSTETICENAGTLNGSWTHNQRFVCMPILCPYDDLPRVSNGIFNASSCEGNRVGDGCNLTCAENHFPSTIKRTTCENKGYINGTWSHEMGVSCTAITCPYKELPEVSKGFFDTTSCSGNLVGDACNLTCYDNFYPTFSALTICENHGEATGKWSHEDELVCTAVTCSYAELPEVSNGFFDADDCHGNHVGAICSLNCAVNFYPTSEIDTVCKNIGTLNGTWSNSTDFVCTAITCPYNELPHIHNGLFWSCHGNRVGSECFVECLSDYYPTSPVTTTCLKTSGGKYGRWSNETGFTCEAVSCSFDELPEVRNGTFSRANCSGNLVGDNCTLTCLEDYYPISLTQTVCKNVGDPIGIWIRYDFVCEAVFCPFDWLTVTSGSYISGCSGNHVGDECYVNCSVGYYITAEETSLVCQNNGGLTGTWSEDNAYICEAILCSFDKLPSVTNGSFNASRCSGNQLGDSCNLTCIPDFFPTNATETICEIAGTTIGSWSNDNDTSCSAVRCSFDDLSNIGNAAYECVGNLVGDVCKVECIDGYDSPFRINCTNVGTGKGQWSNIGNISCPEFWSIPTFACTSNSNIPPLFRTTKTLQECKDLCLQETSKVCLSIDYHEAHQLCFLGYHNQHNVPNFNDFTAPCYFEGYQYAERLDVGSWTVETDTCIVEAKTLWSGEMVDLASCKLVCSQKKDCCSVTFKDGECHMDKFTRNTGYDTGSGDHYSFHGSCGWIYTERIDLMCPRE